MDTAAKEQETIKRRVNQLVDVFNTPAFQEKMLSDLGVQSSAPAVENAPVLPAIPILTTIRPPSPKVTRRSKQTLANDPVIELPASLPDVRSAPAAIRVVPCNGTVAFFCQFSREGHAPKNRCPQSNTRWKTFYRLLAVARRTPKDKRMSIQKLIEGTKWRVSAIYGIAEIFGSRTCVNFEPDEFHSVESHLKCAKCLQYCCFLIKSYCKKCSEGAMERVGPVDFRIDFMRQPVQAEPKIIVMSLARSSDDEPIQQGYYNRVHRFVVNCHSRGRLPQHLPLCFMGQFASYGNAQAMLETFIHLTNATKGDDSHWVGSYWDLACLPDAIIQAYRAGDYVVLAMTHPASFPVLANNMIQFIQGLEGRGIPPKRLIFMAYGLRIVGERTVRRNTLVYGSEMLRFFQRKDPVYPNEPPVNAWGFVMKQAIFQRENQRQAGRNNNSSGEETEDDLYRPPIYYYPEPNVSVPEPEPNANAPEPELPPVPIGNPMDFISPGPMDVDDPQPGPSNDWSTPVPLEPELAIIPPTVVEDAATTVPTKKGKSLKQARYGVSNVTITNKKYGYSSTDDSDFE